MIRHCPQCGDPYRVPNAGPCPVCWSPRPLEADPAPAPLHPKDPRAAHVAESMLGDAGSAPKAVPYNGPGARFHRCGVGLADHMGRVLDVYFRVKEGLRVGRIPPAVVLEAERLVRAVDDLYPGEWTEADIERKRGEAKAAALAVLARLDEVEAGRAEVVADAMSTVRTMETSPDPITDTMRRVVGRAEVLADAMADSGISPDCPQLSELLEAVADHRNLRVEAERKVRGG